MTATRLSEIFQCRPRAAPISACVAPRMSRSASSKVAPAWIRGAICSSLSGKISTMTISPMSWRSPAMKYSSRKRRSTPIFSENFLHHAHGHAVLPVFVHVEELVLGLGELADDGGGDGEVFDGVDAEENDGAIEV